VNSTVAAGASMRMRRYDPPRAKNDSIARHLQDALAAALRENERLDGDLKAALAEVERYRRRFGPLPP
jgi:hypothetical protein